MLSDESRRLLESVPPRPSRRAVGVEASRLALRSQIPFFGTATEPVAVEDTTVRDVPVRRYRATTSTDSPCLVYAHGGGWALGDLDTHDAWCRRLAARAECHVVAVDYRQPPDHPYPAALDDVGDVVTELLTRPERYAIDGDRVAVGGDSAGGNLTAAVCQRLGSEGLRIRHQLLVLPVVDNDVERYASYDEYRAGPGLTREDMEWYFEQYLGDRWWAVTDPGAVPMRAESLASLPPTTILTAECDPVRDEAEAYGERLTAAGVPTRVRRSPGAFHPFFLYHDQLAEAREALRFCAEELRAAFG